MPRRPDFEPVETAKGWMISVPPGMSATGCRVRRFFADEKKAAAFGAGVRAKHTAGVRGMLPAEVALQASEALRILQPLGISLIEAARIAARAAGSAEVAERFMDRWLRVVAEGETHWSERYAQDMGKLPRWLGEEAMGMRCGELSAEVIRTALRANGACSLGTVEMRARYVSAVLGSRERVRPQREIEILTPAQVARLLRAAETVEQRRVVALLVFAGIRPDAESGEIARLQWEAVGKTEIYVSREVSKVSDRHVVIHPRLARLLRGHPAVGPVVPAGWRRAWQRIRRVAGISEMQDVCRHTFASYLLAFHNGDEGPVKMAMGHTAGSSTLFRFYRRAVTAEAGLKFFGKVAETKKPSPKKKRTK